MNKKWWVTISIKTLSQVIHVLNLVEIKKCVNLTWTTPGRRQSKTLSTIYEHGSKIDRNSVFDCQLSPVWQQMTIKNSVFNDFGSTFQSFLDNIGVFDCRLPGVWMPPPESLSFSILYMCEKKTMTMVRLLVSCVVQVHLSLCCSPMQ